MRRLVAITGCILAVALGTTWAQGLSAPPTRVCQIGVYACPNHLDMQATWPARCPVCQVVTNQVRPIVAAAAGTGAQARATIPQPIAPHGGGVPRSIVPRAGTVPQPPLVPRVGPPSMPNREGRPGLQPRERLRGRRGERRQGNETWQDWARRRGWHGSGRFGPGSPPGDYPNQYLDPGYYASPGYYFSYPFGSPFPDPYGGYYLPYGGYYFPNYGYLNPWYFYYPNRGW